MLTRWYSTARPSVATAPSGCQSTGRSSTSRTTSGQNTVEEIQAEPRPSAAIPGIPGAAEAGLDGYESTFSFGLYFPAGTPRVIVDKVQQAAHKAMSAPGVAEKVASQGMDVDLDASPAAFAKRLAAAAPAIHQLVRESGARIE